MELFALGDDPVIGISLDGQGATALALDADGKPLRAADTRFSRGFVYVRPVPGAVSYVLTPVPAPAVSLTCDRVTVVPGETVSLQPGGQTLSIPDDAKIGSQIWHTVDGEWIDFTVVPLVTTELNRTEQGYVLQLTSHVADAVTATVQFGGEQREVALRPGAASPQVFAADAPAVESVRELPLLVTAGDLKYRQTWWARTRYATQPMSQPTENMDSGERLRGGPERNLDGRLAGDGALDAARVRERIEEVPVHASTLCRRRRLRLCASGSRAVTASAAGHVSV